MPSSLATALSTALSGSGIAGTSGGGTSDSDWAVGGGAGSAGLASQPRDQRQQQRGNGRPGQCVHAD